MTVGRILRGLAMLGAVGVLGMITAAPANADYFRYPKCVVAREMRVFPSSTSDRVVGHVYFSETVWAAQESNGRYHVTWYQAFEWWQGWISADPAYTDRGECTGTPI